MSKQKGEGKKASTLTATKKAAAPTRKTKALKLPTLVIQPADATARKRRFPKQGVAVAAGAALVLALIVFFSSGDKPSAPQGTPRKATGDSPQTAALWPGAVPESPVAPMPALPVEGVPVIRAIRFDPSQPTRVDTLKAEVLADAPDPGRLSYAYVWKVNDRIVEGAQGDRLDLSRLEIKKWDLVSVGVTPSDGERLGFTVESPVVAVHSIAPTLELQLPQKARKATEPLEMQLVSAHPDSDGVTFGLGSPVVPGMTIDPRSGKITWMIQPDQKGTIRFGAVVEDTEQTRVSKVFEVVVEKQSVAPVPAAAAVGTPQRPADS